VADHAAAAAAAAVYCRQQFLEVLGLAQPQPPRTSTLASVALTSFQFVATTIVVWIMTPLLVVAWKLSREVPGGAPRLAGSAGSALDALGAGVNAWVAPWLGVAMLGSFHFAHFLGWIMAATTVCLVVLWPQLSLFGKGTDIY
jgi:hypothetical protein